MISSAMRAIIIIVFIILLGGIAYVALNLYTNKKLCGWKGSAVNWECKCLGVINTNTYYPSRSSISRTDYYCSGFNLSCSEISLKIDTLINPSTVRPVDCNQNINK